MTNASTTLNIGWRRQTYVFNLVESTDPVLVLNLIAPVYPSERPVSAGPTPASLRAFIQTARLFPHVEAQHPEQIRNVECHPVHLRQSEPDCDITIERVFEFAADDTLVFQVRLVNQTAERIAYLPSTLNVRVGGRVFPHALAEADGMVPPCGEATAWLAVSGGVNGVPPGLSPRNAFQVTLDRLGPVSRKRCPSIPRPVNPARSPKHESLFD